MLSNLHKIRQEALNRFYRYGEPALAIGSSAIAEPVSGLAGIGSLLSGKSASDAALAIAQAQAAMTYQPRTAQGMQGLQSFQQVMQPVGEVIQGASQNLGDKAYSATGSPLAGAIGYSLPTAMLEGLGLKGLNIARKPVSGADLYSARMGFGKIQNFRTPDFEMDPSELADVGADVNDGFVTLYHRTTPEKAKSIQESGRFDTKEDGVFFSTSLDGQAKDYGAGVVKVKVPVSMLQLDDIFDGEAHVRVPMKKAGSIDLSSFMLKDEKPAQPPRMGAGAVDADKWSYISNKYNSRKPEKTIKTNSGEIRFFDASDADGTFKDAAYYDKDGNVIGTLFSGPDTDGKWVGSVEVRPDMRRQGIATALYNEMENFSGAKMKPAEKNSSDAQAFWKSRSPEPLNPKSISEKYKQSGVESSITERPNEITLQKVIVPKEARGAGVGSRFMNDLIQYADEQGKTVSLTPSADFGGNKARLTEFYKRFGFVENKGKNKDYEISELMYRPKK